MFLDQTDYDLKKYIYETKVFYIYQEVADLRTEKNNLKRWLKKNQITLLKIKLKVLKL